MDEEEIIERFGLPPKPSDLPAIRAELAAATALEEADDDHSNTTAMKALCVQLYAAGLVEDALLVWRAKQASFDAGCSIDVQLLCGAGLEPTLAFLRIHEPDAAAYIEACIATGDFDGDRLAHLVADYRAYYDLE